MNEEQKIELKKDVYKIELEKLFEQHDGELTPEQVVNSAKKASSPLHDYFNWEDSDAAKLWRLHQARVLFGYIKVDLSNIKCNNRQVRIAIQVVNNERKSVYVPTLTAVKTKSYAKQLADEIRAELETLTDKMALFSQNLK